jgi:hypothetical protein
MIKRYVKRPTVISAVKWTGHNFDEIAEFVKGKSLTLYKNNFDTTRLFIETPEGDTYVEVGDYIIQGVHGEYYSCKPRGNASNYE